MSEKKGIYVVLINVHGLVRGTNPEIGRDADTDSQTRYVVEVAQALAKHPRVERVDLMTRLISDSKVSSDYSVPIEDLGNGAYIVRLECGPGRYIRKELLWPHLFGFSDQALQHVKKIGRVPDIIHSHYADSGFVGKMLSGLLGVPHIFTGHSLGRVEQMRLLGQGLKEEAIEDQYNMSQRIEAEEQAIESAVFVVASTRQEAENHYTLYGKYQPKRMAVIPPGTDVSKFSPPRRGWSAASIRAKIDRFFMDPKKPILLSMSTANMQENISTLVRAYGENKQLQEVANLAVVTAPRDNIAELASEAREVITEMLYLIDRYNLYGNVAYPKDIQAADMPDLYKLAKKTGGVFINPSLTESFGLNLLEAASSGLPVIATNEGGPRDIVTNCKNGMLIDSLDTEKMGQVLVDSINNQSRWMNWSRNGIKGVERHYSWDSHVEKYLKAIDKRAGKAPKKRAPAQVKSQLPMADRIFICEIDQTLIGDSEALRQLIPKIKEAGPNVGFGIATGRAKDSAVVMLKEWGVPAPDFMITSVGTEIYYGTNLVADAEWERHIDYKWAPDEIREAVKAIEGMWMQPHDAQQKYKISYYIDPSTSPTPRQIRRILKKKGINVNLIYSHRKFLDIVPVRASKGKAVQFLSEKWGFPPERILVAGVSGTDEDMLRGDTVGVVVGNYARELNKLKGKYDIYFTNGNYAWGIMEAFEQFDFFGQFHVEKKQMSNADLNQEDEEEVEEEVEA
jgi:sucrose-phosphate synthase